VAVSTTLPLIAVVLATHTFTSVATAILLVLPATAVVIDFVVGIKVDNAVFGLEPAGTAAILLVVVGVLTCVLATGAAAVLGIAISPAAKEDIVLHSRPLLIVPVDNTFVVAATVAAAVVAAVAAADDGADGVAGVVCFLAVGKCSLSATISGCLLGLTSLWRPFSGCVC